MQHTRRYTGLTITGPTGPDSYSWLYIWVLRQFNTLYQAEYYNLLIYTLTIYLKNPILQTLSLKTFTAYHWEKCSTFIALFNVARTGVGVAIVKNSVIMMPYGILLYNLYWFLDVPPGKSLNLADCCYKAYSWCLVPV